MPILINRDGTQLGPYSLEEARALVLSGKIDADDWAWTEGATDWVHLKEVPGFAAAAKPTVAPAKTVGTAPAATSPVVDEEQLWTGHPSQVLNLSIYLFWAVVLIAALVVAVIVYPDSQLWAVSIFAAVAIVAAAQCAWAYVHLHAIEYVISTQRVRIIAGIFSKDIKEIELFRVKDTMVRQSFFLRLFGLGTITIISGDERLPRLVLDGIPGAVDMRERLRQEVMTLRQKFGVRELDVM
jgi:membrane protein YdbS with pleckstrin-like domain